MEKIKITKFFTWRKLTDYGWSAFRNPTDEWLVISRVRLFLQDVP